MREPRHKAAVPLIDFEVPWASISPEQAGLARAPLETLISECQKTDTDALLVLAGEARWRKVHSGARHDQRLPVPQHRVKGGDKIEVTIELDDAPRTVEVPADSAAALKRWCSPRPD